MKGTVDARGLSCPQPVLLTKNAIDEGAFPIEVLVDTATARDNVERTARRAGLKVVVEPAGEAYRLLLDR
jgi:tRNA 2-thiouridine synthesizing protein A